MRLSASFKATLLVFIHLKHSLVTSQAADNGNHKDVSTDTNHHSLIKKTNHSVPMFALHHSHHVYVYIGSPPQRRFVIVDTGSSTLSFPCKPCYHCGTLHFSKEYFDGSLSTTHLNSHCHLDECVFPRQMERTCGREDECNFKQSYSEGSSLKGFEVEDIAWLGTENFKQSMMIHMQNAAVFTFGCHSEETGTILKQHADGIMGLLSFKQDNIVDAMYKSGVISNRAFSLCMTKKGGKFSLGGTAMAESHLEPMRMVPLVHPMFFTVNVKTLHVGNITLGEIGNVAFNSGKGTVVDSGTTDTFLPKMIRDVFKDAWKKNSGDHEFSNAILPYTFEQFEQLPDLKIELSNGYMWTIDRHAYMEMYEKKVENRVLDMKNGWSGAALMFNTVNVDEPSGAVLGANAMIGHDLLFDIEEKTLGIAKATC